MAEQRMIQCPRCNGHEFLYGEIGPEPVAFGCPVCRGSGTIPDRRAPSAAERAVERIKEAGPLDPQKRDHAGYWFGQGYVSALNLAKAIIREEAERG